MLDTRLRPCHPSRPSRPRALRTWALAAALIAAAPLGADPVSMWIGGVGASPALAHYPAVDLAEIAERSTPSVVNIWSTQTKREGGQDLSPFLEDPFFRRFFQLPPGDLVPQERQTQSLGSGVIVTTEGIVLTNNHVVEGADRIRVTLSDNREFDAELVGTDPQSDVAVLRIEKPPGDLRAIAMGDSTALRLGDTVLAIGNPFGVGQTVTMGIVSAKGRANVGIADYEDFIQTDAAINPGNSGGALLNVRGELVGINTAIVSRSGGYQGIGFAIPSNMARSIMDSLVEHGRVVRGWLGVAIQPLDRDLAEAIGAEQGKGVLVSDVTAKGPADEAGIRRGDIILSVDGKKVGSTGELRNLVASSRAGSEVKVVVLRDKKEKRLDVELGELPANEKAVARGPAARDGLLAGVEVGALDEDVRRRYDIAESVEAGAVVVALARESAAARSGLVPGDVVLEIDRKRVRDVAEFRRLAAKTKGKTALLLVARRTGTAFVLIKR